MATAAVVPFEQLMRRGGEAALQEAERFFMRIDRVHDTLRRITARLRELGIPHAVAGGMSLVAHGCPRTTVDVDILVTADGLRRIHEALDGLDYVPPFTGSRNLRDTTTGVRIEFLVTGQYPGDGKPKPIAFPDPDEAATEIDGIRYVSLVNLVELKLTSGMSLVTRAKDIGDVTELIRVLQLARAFAERLHPHVRPKFLELWDALQHEPPAL